MCGGGVGGALQCSLYTSLGGRGGGMCSYSFALSPGRKRGTLGGGPPLLVFWPGRGSLLL